MKPATTWSYAPYRPPFYDAEDEVLYICRIAPTASTVHLEWLGGESSYTLFWRKREESEYTSSVTVSTNEYTVSDLEPNTHYAFLLTAGEKKSRVRLVYTADAVGTVVNYLHPEDDAYAFSGKSLCSPCMIRHPDGYLLASMDVFKANEPQNLTMIFRSDDDGASWHYLTDLYPCFWGRMFIKDGALYMLACSTEYGDLIIGRSDDGGKTFAPPVTLLRGSGKCHVAGIHKNPQPLLTYQGRTYTTLEWGTWSKGYHAAMIGSFPENGDPLDVASWQFSDPVPYDPSWEGTGKGKSAGNIEGTLAVLPDGKLYNIMRYDMTACVPSFGRVLAYRVEQGEGEVALRYSHAIELPGNHTKFMIRYDEVSRFYYTVICRITDASIPRDRRLVSLMRSTDGENWDLVTDLLDYRGENAEEVGFQYIDFFIEGDDILWLCRTAMNHPINYHDSNYSTFHRLENFRSL